MGKLGAKWKMEAKDFPECRVKEKEKESMKDTKKRSFSSRRNEHRGPNEQYSD